MDKKSTQQLHVFFNPQSVAVVGVSKNVEKAGHVVFKNFVDNKKRGLFKEKLFPVNLHENSILGFQCYPSLAAIPEEIELVVIVVPVNQVIQVMEDVASKRAKGVIIISSGFSEVGNHKLENQIVKIAKKNDIRILGPNCLGVYNSKTGVDTLFPPKTKILATGKKVIANPRPKPGKITIVTQSGAFGVSSLDYLAGRQIGVSKFISFGNKCDIDETELLHYLLYDDETKVILLYIEDIKAGRKFLKIAKEVTRKKPVVVLKTGKTVAGARAAASHTGALVGSDQVYSAVFTQTGILRAKDMKEFFDIGKALAMQLPIAGKNIGIITDAGGPGVMAADECELIGLSVKRFSENTIRKFERLKKRGTFPKFATNYNPVDLTGSATSEMYRYAAEILFQDPEIHGIIVLGLHHIPALKEDFIDKTAIVANKYDKPIVACDIGETEMALYIRYTFDKLGVPAYPSPEDAARAMKGLVDYGLYLQNNECLKNYKQHFHKDQHKIL